MGEIDQLIAPHTTIAGSSSQGEAAAGGSAAMAMLNAAGHAINARVLPSRSEHQPPSQAPTTPATPNSR